MLIISLTLAVLAGFLGLIAWAKASAKDYQEAFYYTKIGAILLTIAYLMLIHLLHTH